jgi:hypothetical protein
MRKLFLVSVIAGLAAIGFTGQAHAKPGGCVKGAIVGGIAGHFAGHGGIGAAAGCAYGMHERSKYNQQQEHRSSAQQHDTNKQHAY